MKSNPSFSRQKIVSAFKKSADLTTIALKQTIMVEPADKTHGSERFALLMKSLYEATKDQDLVPKLIWVSQERDSLLDVVRPLESHDQATFRWLLSYGSFAELAPGSELSDLIANDLVRISPEESLALTAIANQPDGMTFSYQVHSAPKTKDGRWPKGPIYRTLKAPPLWLNDAIQQLHILHNSITNNSTNLDAEKTLKLLETRGVSMMRLEKFIES